MIGDESYARCDGVVAGERTRIVESETAGRDSENRSAAAGWRGSDPAVERASDGQGRQPFELIAPAFRFYGFFSEAAERIFRISRARAPASWCSIFVSTT